MSEPSTVSNPAARLLAVLYSLRGRASRKPTEPLGRSLAAHFGLNYPDDLPELLRLTSHLLGMPSQYRAAMDTVGLDVKPFLNRVGNIETAFASFSLPTQIAKIMAPIDDTTVNQLEMSEAILRQHYSEAALSQADEEQILELLDEVDEDSLTDLSENAQDFLARHLQSIREAVHDAQIVGVQPVKDAGYLAVGELVARPGVREELASKPAGSKFWTVVTCIFLATEVAHSALQVPADLKALGSGSDPAPVVVEVELVDGAKP